MKIKLYYRLSPESLESVLTPTERTMYTKIRDNVLTAGGSEENINWLHALPAACERYHEAIQEHAIEVEVPDPPPGMKLGAVFQRRDI